MMLNRYKTCIKGTIWFLKRVIEEINLLDLHLFVVANTLFSELGNALRTDKNDTYLVRASMFHSIQESTSPATTFHIAIREMLWLGLCTIHFKEARTTPIPLFEMYWGLRSHASQAPRPGINGPGAAQLQSSPPRSRRRIRKRPGVPLAGRGPELQGTCSSHRHR